MRPAAAQDSDCDPKKLEPPTPEIKCVEKKPLPGKLYGVTLNSVWGSDEELAEIEASLSHLSRKPTTRLVFDECVRAEEYRHELEYVDRAGHVLGEILDSSAMELYDLVAYEERTREYLAALCGEVDIWEIGNEVNAETAGSITEIVEKIASAYQIVKKAKQPTALTLYYNAGCSEPEHEMFRWVEQNLPSNMKAGLDYVFVSYYEDDCNGLQPPWPDVFDRLAGVFPNSRLGFGEIGTKAAGCKKEYITRYYSMHLDLEPLDGGPRYVGGYFWWYGRQDFVPHEDNEYWQTLNEVIEDN